MNTTFKLPYLSIPHTPWQALPLRTSRTELGIKWAVRIRNSQDDTPVGSFDLTSARTPDVPDILLWLRQLAEAIDANGKPTHSICQLLRADDPDAYRTMIAPLYRDVPTAGEW